LTVKNSPTKRTSDDASSAIVVAGSLTIESGKYAVYTYKGSYSGLLRAYTYIYSKEKGRLRNALSFEEYVTWSDNPAKQITKIYIPIQKK